MKLQIKSQGTILKSPWVPDWADQFEVSGREEIPILKPSQIPERLTGMNSPSRHKNDVDNSMRIMHLYQTDMKLINYYRNPARLLSVAHQYAAVITPDFSILQSMPTHQRIRSVIQSREIGAYLQSHGLQVIPNIRWADNNDLSFVLEGLPKHTVIAISTQTIMNHSLTRLHFHEGLEKVIAQLEPKVVLIYGSLRKLSNLSLFGGAEVRQFDTDIFQAFVGRNK